MGGLRTIPLVLEPFLEDGLSRCQWQRWQKRKVNKRLNFLQLQMMDWPSRPSEIYQGAFHLFLRKLAFYISSHLILKNQNYIGLISAWFRDSDQG